MSSCQSNVYIWVCVYAISNQPLHVRVQVEQEQTQQHSSYDKETLDKLRAGTPSLPASVRTSLTADDDALLHEKFPSTLNAKITSGGIPDASAIIAAKKKREQMRKGFNITESDDGFIPLDDKADDEEDVGLRAIYSCRSNLTYCDL